MIKEKYKNIIGVDISENMLKKAQSLYPNIKFGSEDESDACALCICWGIQEGWVR